ncbi:hypothetical protein PORUE0001_1325 [Porphyromonas uenonis 60-3]|uniref:Uncharacterized protein n=1 Tax=Porphyromonas uenonis 60-3 TaxID=596327 RepID=C2MCK9_9PORP|nr:hypothetical protein PORUE0001_1325 [Porphyromonas uenonis 60-3]
MLLTIYNLPYKGSEKRDISPLRTPQLTSSALSNLTTLLV